MAENLSSALGLTLIALAGASAGFLAASVPTPGETADVGPIPPGEARRLAPLESGLEVSTAGQGPGMLVLFDENGTYERTIRIPGDRVRTLEGAEPVVRIALVPATSAPLELDLPSPDRTNVTETPTRESTRTLASSGGGTVDADLSLRMPTRPASLALEVDGRARDLDATVRTRAGPAFRQVNATWPVNGTIGTARLFAGNLTNGTYRVSLHADRLDGRVLLVARTFDAANRSAPLQPASQSLDRLGALTARAGPGEAWQLATQDARGVTLAVERGAWARVHLYDDDNRLARQVEVGQRGPSWDWGSNGSSAPPYQAARLDVPDGVYVLHVANTGGEANHTVYALLAGLDRADPARQLPIETKTVEVPYPAAPGSTSTRTVRYPGGLVDLEVTGGQGPAVDRRVVVDSPLGVVFREQTQAAVDDQSGGTESVKHLERFGSGPLEIRVEADAAVGSVEFAFEHFVP